MIDAWVLSVPHTGTRFLQRLLGAGGCHTHHFRRPPYDAVWAVPLRDPAEVVQSYVKRGKNVWDMADAFDALWEQLLLVGSRIIFVPIDMEDQRAEAIVRLQQAGVDVSLPVDWSPVGSWAGLSTFSSASAYDATQYVFSQHDYLRELYRPSGETESA
jgi:hypothetical protein